MLPPSSGGVESQESSLKQATSFMLERIWKEVVVVYSMYYPNISRK
jgi:hypothetical protein